MPELRYVVVSRHAGEYLLTDIDRRHKNKRQRDLTVAEIGYRRHQYRHKDYPACAEENGSGKQHHMENARDKSRYHHRQKEIPAAVFFFDNRSDNEEKTYIL